MIDIKLSELLLKYRADRPDEWTMDDFVRSAEKQEKRIKELESEFMQLFAKARDVADLFNDYEAYSEKADEALEELQVEIGGHEDKPYY